MNESTGYSIEMVNDRTVSKAEQVDVEAFGEIFEATNQGIYNFLLHLSSDRELAADLTQETFIRAFSALKSLKKRKALNSWLHRIALNLYRDAMRKPRLDTESIEHDDGTELEIVDLENHPEKIVTDAELQNVIRDAIQSLPEIHKAVVIMYHLEGMVVEEIAKTMEIEKGTVMSRLARARETLRCKLIPYIGETS